jgi:flavin-dependent dehydrogenase
MSYDIAIIGGSISGLSVAQEISNRCDANIVIIEEHKQIGKPANSSIFSFIETVKKYDLNKSVVRYYNKFRWYSSLGTFAKFKFEKPKFVVLDYKKICQELIDKSSKKNLEIYTGNKALDLERIKNKTIIKTQEKGSYEKKIKCDLLIDASGSSFISRKYFSHRIPRLYSIPYGYKFNNCEIPKNFLDSISFFVGKSIGTGGGWFYPLSKRICHFGIAEIKKTPLIHRDILHRKLEYAKAHMQPFNKLLKNAVYSTRKSGVIPAEPMKKIVTDGIMRVGDASGHAIPHIYEGVRPCLESSRICGKIASEAYEKRDYSKNILTKYERLWQRKYKLLHLYLLSIAEVAYTLNDWELDKSVKELVKRETEPEVFLTGLKGCFKFPFSLITRRPDITYLKNLIHFIYHNIRWMIE